jgi:hypothetical protein
VNVRFAVERHCRPNSLDRALEDRIVAAASELPYEVRNDRAISRRGGLLDQTDSAALISMLEASDLKRQDAQVVLEAVEQMLARGSKPSTPTAGDPAARSTTRRRDSHTIAGDAGTGGVLIWESGDHADMHELIEFLGYTGLLEHHGRPAVARSCWKAIPWSCELLPEYDYGDSNPGMESASPAIRIHHYWSRDEYFPVNEKLPREVRIKEWVSGREKIVHFKKQFNEVPDDSMTRLFPSSRHACSRRR